MAAEDDKNGNFYAILGLKKECTPSELRIAYKKLAMKWHPDRCTAVGNSKHEEEAKKKFQAIQQAYSVLSDANKRFLYDVGVYDCNDDEDETGMGDFLNEMAVMMTQNNANKKIEQENLELNKETMGGENGEQSLEELQELFNEIFQGDIDSFSSSSRSSIPPTCSSSSSYASFNGISGATNKRNSSEISSNNMNTGSTQFDGFCMGLGGMSANHQVGESSRRKVTRKGGRK